MQYNVVGELKTEARRRLVAEDGGELSRWVSLGIGTTREKNGFRLAARIRGPVDDPVFQERVERKLLELVGVRDQLDLQYTGPVFAIRPGDAGVRSPRLRIGSSISHIATRSGTLGFFARSLIDGNGLGLVSANHVIGKQDRANEGEAIVHPGGDSAGARVAEFVRYVALGGGGEKFVDCAFARLATDNFDLSLLPDGSRLESDASATGESIRVAKFGSSSKERKGTITSFNKDDLRVLSYRTGVAPVDFDDQIEIESADPKRRFSLDGDSGSLVINENRRAVGLLFAHTIRGGTFGNGFAYVNPMSHVLDLLQVELATQ